MIKVIAKGACDFHIHVLDMVVFAHFGSRELSGLLNLGYFLVPKADDNIFRLEVRMNNLAHPVNVVKADEALAG